MLYQNKVIGTVAYMGGVPAVLEEFCWSWGQLVQFNSEYLCQAGEVVQYDRARVSYHAFARNQLVTRMRGEWLLLLDTDHQFEPDLAVRLVHRLYKYDLDVVTGLYQFKGPPFSPVLYTPSEDGESFLPIGAWDPVAPLFQVAAAGAGCLLVRKRVFERMRLELKEEPFDILPPLSEDLSFFKRLQRLGVRAFCDSRVEAYHLRTVPLSLIDYDQAQVQVSEYHQVEGYR